MSGWTSGTEDKVLVVRCFALQKLKLLLAGAVQVVLATHSFQAPGFYERLGYERRYVIEGRPTGYADIIYVKALQRTASPGA
jgi:hypothetical protein